jgi:hypothetical protein
LGRAPRQTDLLRSTVDYCRDRFAFDARWRYAAGGLDFTACWQI